MSIGIYLEVKFRAFGFTFGSMRQGFLFNGTILTPSDITKPDDARKVWDKNGVKLHWWPVL